MQPSPRLSASASSRSAFFTNVLEGHLQYFLDREIPRHIGNGGSIRSVADTSYFESALRRHCRETTIIMRAFAKDWLPFLNGYRTMCLAPEPDFRRVLEEVQDMWLAA